MPDPNHEEALEQQQTLVESSLAAVFEAYEAALDEEIRQPVVMVVDCEDEIGAAIAGGWLGEEAIQDEVAGRGEDEQTVVFSAAFSWEDCCREVPALFPYLGPIFDAPPPEDGVLVIGVTAGGASALTAPFDARP